MLLRRISLIDLLIIFLFFIIADSIGANPSDTSSEGLSLPILIAIIVVGVIVVAAIIGALVYFLVIRNRSNLFNEIY